MLGHDALKPLLIIRNHRLVDDGFPQAHGQVVIQTNQPLLHQNPGGTVNQHDVNRIALSRTRFLQQPAPIVGIELDVERLNQGIIALIPAM